MPAAGLIVREDLEVIIGGNAEVNLTSLLGIRGGWAKPVELTGVTVGCRQVARRTEKKAHDIVKPAATSLRETLEQSGKVIPRISLLARQYRRKDNNNRGVSRREGVC